MTEKKWVTIDFNNHTQVCRFLQKQSDRITELEKENEQLKQLLDEAEDIIMCQCTPHYQRQWENIKKNLKGDVE